MERPARRLDGRVLRLWWTTAAAAALVAWIALAILAESADMPVAAALLIGVVVAVVAVVFPYIAYRRWRYEIRERDLLISHGAIYHVTTSIPFDRIQFVETRQGPLDRLFNLTRLVVYTAAGRAGQIPGLDVSEAGSVREELSSVAGADTV
jgi:membrane protein YdbS with pleckstrin-like domain